MKVMRVPYADPEASRLFVQSIRETGFAVLSDHPIPHELINQAYEEWERFFSSDQKYRYKFDPQNQSGYFPFRSENAKGYHVSDLKEFYHYYPLKTDLPSGTTRATPELYRRLEALGAELLSWIDENSPDEIRARFSLPLSEMIDRSQETLLRPIHYPPLTGAEEPEAVRAAAHEDINLITLLPAATSTGLQVKDTAGRWYEVASNHGELVVNAGDMLQMASGNFFRSTTHRVVNPVGDDRNRPRYSMPLFLHPRAEVQLSKTHTAGSYLRERLQEIGLLKKAG